MRSFFFIFSFLPLFAFTHEEAPWKQWDRGGTFSRKIEQPNSYFSYYLEKLHELNSLVEISDEHLSLSEIQFIQQSISQIFDNLSILEHLELHRLEDPRDYSEEYEDIILHAALWKKMKKKYKNLASEWGSRIEAYKEEKVKDLKEKAHQSSSDFIKRMLELEQE